MKKNKLAILTALTFSVASSLCCITPILVLISGIAGVTSAFSWIEPARPYLIALTIIILGFVWYQKLKPKKSSEILCDCEADNISSFWQKTSFLGIVSFLSILLLIFPFYGNIFFPKSQNHIMFVPSKNINEIKFDIEGMTCSSCEEHIKLAVNKLPGIIFVNVDYKNGFAKIKFEKNNTDKFSIIKVINATGYKVKNTSY